MNSSDQYICAFRGRRDNYQVPLALQEAKRLRLFITDAYAPAWIEKYSVIGSQRLTEKMLSRREASLDDQNVRCLWGTTVLERFRHLAGYPRVETYALLDRNYSLAAAAQARKTRANLFLYSPYAWEAFSASYGHTPNKILFQYHPHWAVEASVLEKDAREFSDLHPSIGAGGAESIASIKSDARARSDDSWKLADHVACASQFTRATLLEAGAKNERISVVPYGVTLPRESDEVERDQVFHVLFVGSGIQRKGLHHLLLAWERARLPAGSVLTLVCRILEPAFVSLIACARNVRLMREVTYAQLAHLYSSATLFAMPSLIEGFGQVYLEALSYGLPVLGTRNTCVPDLGGEIDGVYCNNAGDLDALIDTLERLSKILPGKRDVNRRARLCAAQFSWARFRAGIRSLL